MNRDFIHQTNDRVPFCQVAGADIGVSDALYQAAGATLALHAQAVFARADMIYSSAHTVEEAVLEADLAVAQALGYSYVPADPVPA